MGSLSCMLLHDIYPVSPGCKNGFSTVRQGDEPPNSNLGCIWKDLAWGRK